MDAVDEKALNDQLATLLVKLEDITKGEAGLTKQADRIKALEAALAEKVDTTALTQSVDKIHAAQEKLAKQIRTSKHGMYFPGVEDVEFNLTRCLLGKRMGWDKVPGSQHELEVCTEASKAAAAVYGKGSQNIGDDAAGGFFVPDQVIPDLIAAVYRTSKMLALDGSGQTRVSVLEGLVGGTVKIPKFNGGMIAYWVGEEDAVAESKTTMGDITMNPKKLGVLVRLSEDMRAMGGFGFDRLLRTDMQRAIAVKADNTILRGKGTDNAPRGVFNTHGIKIYSAQSGNFGVFGTDALAGAKFQADWDGAALDFDDLSAMDLALVEDDIDISDVERWTISSPRFFEVLKQLKVDNFTGQAGVNAPYLLGLPMLTDARLREVIGNWDRTNNIPSDDVPGAQIGAPQTGGAAKYSTVLRGDLSQIVVGRWAGIEITDDAAKGKGFASGHLYMRMIMRMDVTIRQPRALIVCPDAKVRA